MRKQYAFTLIEILITVFIIGIVVTVTVLMIDNRLLASRDVEHYALRIKSAIGFCQQRALLVGVPHMMLRDGRGQIQLSQYTPRASQNQWQVINSPRFRQLVNVPKPFSLAFRSSRPNIICYSDGRLSTFQYQLQNRQASINCSSDVTDVKCTGMT